MTASQLQPRHDTAFPLRRRAAALGALSDASQWAIAAARLWRRRRRERDELASLDDRMLADVGLTRGDAEFLANKPFWRE